MTVPCIIDSPTIHLSQDSGGNLRGDLLGLGFGLFGGASRVTVATSGVAAGAVPAPSSSNPLAGTEGELHIHNDRQYAIAILAIQEGSIVNASVPTGEVWAIILQSNINNSGYQAGNGGIGSQTFDNTVPAISDAAGPATIVGQNKTYGSGPMVVPISTVLQPGADVDIKVRLYLYRSGSASGGVITQAVAQCLHFIAVPSL